VPNIDFFSHNSSEAFRMCRSKVLSAVADGTYNVLSIPRNALVSNVWLHISTAFSADGAPSITVGWLGNKQAAQPAGFISNDIAKPLEVGLKRAQKDTLVSFPGKWFDAGSGAITVTIAAGGSTTKAIFTVFAEYAVIF
jgi:hypothetical protein